MIVSDKSRILYGFLSISQISKFEMSYKMEFLIQLNELIVGDQFLKMGVSFFRITTPCSLTTKHEKTL